MSIRITARPVRGIRRVGTFHPPEPVVFPDEYFDANEIEVLRSDADLIVELLSDELITDGEKRHLELLSTSGDPGAGSPGDDPSIQPGAEDGPTNPPVPEIPAAPPVAELEKFLAEIADVEIVLAMAVRDERKSAQPIYEARLAELTAAAPAPGE